MYSKYLIFKEIIVWKKGIFYIEKQLHEKSKITKILNSEENQSERP